MRAARPNSLQPPPPRWRRGRGRPGLSVSWHGLEFELILERSGLALGLGAERELPAARHAEIGLELIDPRLRARHRRQLRRHLRHALWSHIQSGCEDHGVGYGLARPFVDQAHRDDGVALLEFAPNEPEFIILEVRPGAR